MKTFKLTKGIQKIIKTLVVLIAGIVIAEIISNSNVNAGGVGPICSICTTNAYMECTSKTGTSHTYTCTTHGQQKTESHTVSNGTCTVCGYVAHTHNFVFGGYHNNGNAYTHIMSLYCDEAGCAEVKNSTEPHDLNSSNECTECGYGKQENNSHTDTGSGNAGAGTGLPSLDIFQPTLAPGEAGGIMQIIGKILGVLRILGAIMTVVSIAIIGFGTILGSASEKAEYQQKLAGVMFAGIFLIASTSIAKMIISIVENM